MAGRETADIVFCLDASCSMSDAIDGVRESITKFVDSLNSNFQQKWDVRFDFLAYSNSGSRMRLRTVFNKGQDVIDAIYNAKTDPNGGISAGKLFTADIDLFKQQLKNVAVTGDECSGAALDICADFPFRSADTCHRVIVFLTDEAIRTGLMIDFTATHSMDLAKKIQDRKIMLYMITPDCDVFDTLSQIDKCEWTIDNSNGLTAVNFEKLMAGIGKSVSVSQTAGGKEIKVKPIFKANKWRHDHLCEDDEVSMS